MAVEQRPIFNPPPHDPPPSRAAAALMPIPELLSAQDEARAFWRMRRYVVQTLLGQLFSRARLRVSLVAGLSTFLWLVLFWLFAAGFTLLRNTIYSDDVCDQAIRAVFGMFFMALMVMLVFSSAIILYSSLFRARDLAFLLTIPARAERIFLHKFQDALLLSSWAFLLLTSPMLLAYGLVTGVPWYYFVLLVPLLVSFTYIPAVVGALLCLVIVRCFPGGRRLILSLLVALAVVGGALLSWPLLLHGGSDFLTPSWFQELLERMRFTEHRWLPSWWLSSGLLTAARNELAESVLFLALLISNALFLRQVAVGSAARIYRTAYSKLHGWRVVRRRTKVAWIDRAVVRLTPMLSRPTRLLIVKDFRLFRRDPVQWSQFLIFLGLMALYFVNVRRFSCGTYHVGWINMISFLNVYVVGLLLSTFTTRFIFPMISLEGRRFWILGLLPVRRDVILWSKFFFAAIGSLIPCCLLILLSDVMLRVSPVIVATHQLTSVILCSGLAGIAVGLGAKMPSLREESPSRIAAGFGGTLTLVLSSFYILVVVLLTALPSHFYLGTKYSQAIGLLAGRLGLTAWLPFWLVGGSVGAIVLGLLATFLPLRFGIRAFRKLEF